MNRKLLVVASLAILAMSLNVSAEAQCSQRRKAEAPAAAAPTKDIIDTAVGAGSFTTLATALTKANLIETLKGPGPFTVFAPTDAAFKKIPEKDLAAILNDNALLTKILTYHVVPGDLKAADVLKNKSLATVEGSQLVISMNGQQAKVGDAAIVQTDIQTTNGVIHVIDTVLVPSK